MDLPQTASQKSLWLMNHEGLFNVLWVSFSCSTKQNTNIWYCCSQPLSSKQPSRANLLYHVSPQKKILSPSTIIVTAQVDSDQLHSHSSHRRQVYG